MAILLVVALAFATHADARISQPGHQLSVGGVSSGANPQIDAWHNEEQRKIEAECNAMMRKLWAEKRQKLVDLVEAARRRVEEERARLNALLAQAEDEKKELEQAKAKVIEDIDLRPTKAAISDLEARIRELERLIAEKSACIDELRQAEADLEEALRKLAEAQRKLAVSENDVERQHAAIRKEEGDIAPAQADVESAQNDLARAKARHEAARRRLSTAQGDVREHDNEGHSGDYVATHLDTVASEPVMSAPIAPAAVEKSAPPSPKSAAKNIVISMGTAAAIVLTVSMF